MKAIIIDDEPLARMIIVEYLQSHPQIIVVEECNNGFEGVKAIQQHKPDLIFLDIQMPKINGFEMLELLEEIPNVIFTTAFDEYAIKAFELNAIDYLLKPFTQERFNKAIQKLSLLNNTTLQQQKEAVAKTAAEIILHQNMGRIVLKEGSQIKIIPHNAIHYVEACDDYIKIVSNEGSFLKKKTLSSMENELNKQQFSRVHRSYIVNIQLIQKLDPYEKEGHIVTLTTGAKIPVSKTGYIKLKECLGI
ncbi:MAG: LytR/AlgR family response regulator transcription factor [Chitinophagaceae bacterium]